MYISVYEYLFGRKKMGSILVLESSALYAVMWWYLCAQQVNTNRRLSSKFHSVKTLNWHWDLGGKRGKLDFKVASYCVCVCVCICEMSQRMVGLMCARSSASVYLSYISNFVLLALLEFSVFCMWNDTELWYPVASVRRLFWRYLFIFICSSCIK